MIAILRSQKLKTLQRHSKTLRSMLLDLSLQKSQNGNVEANEMSANSEYSSDYHFFPMKACKIRFLAASAASAMVVTFCPSTTGVSIAVPASS
jgi:hypothetical protein